MVNKDLTHNQNKNKDMIIIESKNYYDNFLGFEMPRKHYAHYLLLIIESMTHFTQQNVDYECVIRIQI